MNLNLELFYTSNDIINGATHTFYKLHSLKPNFNQLKTSIKKWQSYLKAGDSHYTVMVVKF